MDSEAEGADRERRERPTTFVAAGVSMTGDIEGPSDLYVQGQVVGRLAVQDLTVDVQGLVDGPVTAEAVVIRGRVIGPVTARTVHLAAGACLDGDVACRSIQIDAGARFNGRCDSEDRRGDTVVALPSADGRDDISGAGQELLMLAARLRRVSG